MLLGAEDIHPNTKKQAIAQEVSGLDGGKIFDAKSVEVRECVRARESRREGEKLWARTKRMDVHAPILKSTCIRIHARTSKVIEWVCELGWGKVRSRMCLLPRASVPAHALAPPRFCARARVIL